MGQGYSTRLDGAAAAAARLRKQRADQARLRTAAPIRNSSISNGGELAVKDANGNIIATIGHDFGLNGRGFSLVGANGIMAFDFYVNPTTGAVSIGMLDTTGQAQFAPDPFGNGTGIYWPWLQFSLADVSNTTRWPSNNTGSFVTIAQGGTNVFSQKLFVEARTLCDSGATAGQVRLLCNGNQVGATASVNTSVGDASFEGVVSDTSKAYAFIELQARVTAGAGNCRAQPYQCNWLQFNG